MNSLFHDNRTANLLQLFCKTPVLSVNALASRLEVSERTIRNDIKALNGLLHGSAAIEGTQGRYTLRIFDQVQFQKAFDRLSHTAPFLNSPRNRLDYIFGKLMRAERPVLTDELAYEMNVGRTTLMGDLKKLRTELEPYRLSVMGKTGKGLSLHGSESDIRRYVLDNTAIYQDYPMDVEIAQIITAHLAGFEKSVQATFEQFVTLMLDRFLTGHYIGTLSAHFYNLTARPEFAAVNALLERIAELLRVEIPVEEKLFALLPIIGMRTPADVQDLQSIPLDETVRELMGKVLRQIQTEMDIRIESSAFTEEFLYHMMFMLNRLRYHVPLKNPLLEDLQEKYPLAWKMAGVAAKVIQTEYGMDVTKDERGYLASYFGVFLEEQDLKQKHFRAAVVCGTGRVTARLVAVQLRRVLDSSAELDLFADEKVSREILNGYDMVLTTVDLPCPCDRPVIRIHEILNEQELLHKIEKARYWDQVDIPMLDNNWFVMNGLLDESRFFVLEAETYDEAVSSMAEKLAADGQVDAGFPERLRDREKKGTMVFGHAAAIPHSIQYAGDKLVLAVGVSPAPIHYQNHDIRVIFMLGLPAQQGHEDGLLIRVYDEIISIVQDAGILDKIAAADTFQALLRALYRQAGK